MQEISLTISIAEREYTLRVKSPEEYLIREASNLINQKYSQLKKTFVSVEKSDLLAMMVFDAMVENLRLKEELEEIAKQIESINENIVSNSNNS